jgi:cystathionine beta-lyase/cystathionine gamma-synthase
LKGNPRDKGFATRTIHAGQDPEPVTGAIKVPIFQTSTYQYRQVGEHTGYEYARVQNPTRRALEDCVASLENGLDGHAFASGMAAISALMTLVRAGEHVISSRNVYGGTYRLFEQVLDRYDLRVSWVDTTSTGAVEQALRPETRLVFLESPTNPLMEITDIAAVAEVAHAAGVKVAVDNTFLSPYLQRPLDLGADIVVHSTTKFLNGHSDSIGGALVSSSAEDAEWFAFLQKSIGAILSPFDSFLTLRGIQTLAVRMERHEHNARAIAGLLAAHPQIERVLYPGLESHPGHELQKTQASGFGALIAFDLGTYERAKIFLDRLQVLSLAESLGGVETLISHPASMTHAALGPQQLAELGIGPGLIRVSVGLEDLEDIELDLQTALEALA